MLVLKNILDAHYVEQGLVQLTVAKVGLVGLPFWLN